MSQCPHCQAHIRSGNRFCSGCGASLDAAPAPDYNRQPLAPGHKLAGGRFAAGKVERRDEWGPLYRGSEPAVRQLVLIRELDVRRLLPGAMPLYTARDLMRQCLERGQLLARLQHPNLASVLAVFEESERCYLVEDVVPAAGRNAIANPPLDEGAVHDLAHSLLDALATLHDAGLAHGAIMPHSVVREGAGRPVLTGYAPLAAHPAGDIRGIQSPVHSTGYSPPERQSGSWRANPASDLYAFGAVLYYWLTGQEPTPAIDRATSAELPEVRWLNSKIGATTAAAVMAALQMDVTRRPSGARQLLAMLTAPAQGPTVSQATLPVAARPVDRYSVPGPTPTVPPPAMASPTMASPPDSADRLVNRPPSPARGQFNRLRRALNARQTSPPAPSAPAAPPTPRKRATPVAFSLPTASWRMRVPDTDDHLKGLGFGSHGAVLVTGHSSGAVHVWNPATRALIRTLTPPDGTDAGALRCLATDPTSELVATGHENGALCLWDSGDGRLLHCRREHAGRINSVAFSPDGYVVTGGMDSTVIVWDAEPCESMQTLTDDSDSITSVDFAPDGRRVVSGSDTGTVQLWNLSGGEPEWSQAKHDLWVTAVAFAPNGNAIASGAYDQQIKVFATEAGMEMQNLSGHAGGITALAFASNSRYLASGGLDATVKLWDAWTGQLQRSFDGPADSITDVVVAPHARCVVGATETEVWLWVL